MRELPRTAPRLRRRKGIVGLMPGAFRQRGWRGAIGLIAAYALVLQAFLAYSTATQATAQDPSSIAANLFVLCTSQDNPDTPHGGNGAPNIERADKLVQLIAKQKGLSHPAIDSQVALVDARLEANRAKAAAA